MVRGLTDSYIALKLENEILKAQMQCVMEENVVLQAQIPKIQKPQTTKEAEPLQNLLETQDPRNLQKLWISQQPRSTKNSQELRIPHISESPRSSQHRNP